MSLTAQGEPAAEKVFYFVIPSEVMKSLFDLSPMKE